MEKSFYKKFEKMQKEKIQQKLTKEENAVFQIEEKIKKLQQKRIKKYAFINNAKEYLK